jgi:hypothetical protein
MDTQPINQMPSNPPPSSKKGLWAAIIILGVIIIVGGIWFILNQKSNSSNQSSYTNSGANNSQQIPASNSNVSGSQQQFPWASYPSEADVNATSNLNTEIGSTVNFSAPGKTLGLAIAQTYNAGPGTNTSKAYIFTALNLGANAHIDVLYAESSTEVVVGAGATIGQKILMSDPDLTSAAMTAAGINQASATPPAAMPQPTPPSSNNNSSSSTSQNNPPPPPAASANYTGSWNGSFTPSAPAAAAGCPNGGLSFNVSSSGTLQGYITVNGNNYYGGGNVSSSGKMTGGWTITLTENGISTNSDVSFTGQLSSSSGSGSYSVPSGCYGTFSVHK